MRSSNLNHVKKPAVKNCKHAKRENKGVKYTKMGSIVITAIIVLSAVVIPSVTLVQNVEAVTNVKKAVFSTGDNRVFADTIVNSGKPDVEVEKKEVVKPTAKVEKKVVKKPVEKKAEETTAATEEETTKAATEPATEKKTEAETEEETQATAASVAKNLGVVSTVNVDSSYQPGHVELSSYDRAKLERLVMGEAGGLGYNGSALVAQAIRDTMVMTGINSIDTIISSYQYTAPTTKQPSADVKRAVSYIFDSDGYAVQHRILYFYAADIVSNAWHETQEFIVSYGNVRFFDKW